MILRTHTEPSWAARSGCRTGEAGPWLWQPLLQRRHGEAGAVTPGARLDAGGCERQSAEPKGRDVGWSCRWLFGFLVKPLREVRGTPSLPVPSSTLPVLLSFLLVASFVLSSGGSEVSPGGCWGAGSRALVCRSPVLTTFLASSPSSALLASALAALGLGADGDTLVAEG